MQRIFNIVMAIAFFLVLSGCGLVTFPSKSIPTESQQTTQKQNNQKNMLLSSDKSTNQPVQMIKKKDEKPYIHTIQERIITVIHKDKPNPPPAKDVVPVVVVQAPKPSESNPTPIPPKPTQEETPPKDGEEPNQQNEKYAAAKKKAEELKGTDQQVTADQGNVYENPGENSNIIHQVLKDQKLHIEDTIVDQDDAEIWCFIKGNNGQKEIVGWVSYQIIEQK